MATLVLRADGGPGIGAGHLARCLALAQAWREGDGDAVLVSRSCPPEWEARFRGERVSIEAPGDEWPDGDWTVLDGYDLQLPARRPSRVLVVSDHGRGPIGDADLVVDPNVGATVDPYARRVPGVDLLAGSRYSLLRREMRVAAQAAAGVPEPERAHRLLVALGGAPAPSHQDSVDTALRRPELAGLVVEQLSGRDDAARPMAMADLAVTGAGVTASELCVFGVPAVLLTLADNQAPVVEAIEAAGAAVRADVMDPAGVAVALAALVRDQPRRAAMAAAGRSLIDGRGALRVAARLRADLLVLRPATADDAGLLFEWVNDPVVRAAALIPGAIDWETHIGWLTSKLADDACRLSIVEVDGAPVGQVRVDGSGDEVEISVGLDQSARGLRLGPAVIDAEVRRTFATTDATKILARIRPSNERSVRAFDDAGFVPDGEGGDDRSRWLRYARRR